MENNEVSSLFLGYIDDVKLGKVAHYIDSNGDNIFYKEFIRDGFILHEELSDLEKEQFLDRLYESDSILEGDIFNEN